jgi:hypothetical protein
MSVRSYRQIVLVSVIVWLLSFLVGPSIAFAQTSPPASEPTPFVQFLNTLFEAVLTALAPIAVAFVIAWVRQLMAKAKAGVSAEQWLLLQSLAATVVAAAEQSGLSKQIEDTARSKKAWAVNELVRLASEHGLKGLNIETFSNIIESEVYRQMNQPVTPVPLVTVPPAKVDTL